MTAYADHAATLKARDAARTAAIDRVIQTLGLTTDTELDSLHGAEVAEAISLHASDAAPTFVAEAVADASCDDLRELLAAVATGDPEAADLLTDIVGNYGRELLENRLIETDMTGEPDDAAEVDAAGRAREARAINAERGL